MSSGSISYHGKKLQCADGESVLQTLLANDISVPYSCRIGNCHTCLMRQVGGEVPAGAQTGLTPLLREKGYFLSCLYYPVNDIEVDFPSTKMIYSNATIVEKRMLAENILMLVLKPEVLNNYYAGQFINLRREDGIVRSYSLANPPGVNELYEVHIKRMRNGQMSNWLFDKVQTGQSIDVHGPIGDSFYTQGDSTQPMMLIGTGTGIAPLSAIVRDALARKHLGEIYLYHGSHSQEGLYLDGMLKQLDEENSTFHYIPCVSGEDSSPGVEQGRAHDIALKQHAGLHGWRVFLCGAPPMVKAAQKMAYLAGADMDDIYIDPFEVRDLRRKPRD